MTRTLLIKFNRRFYLVAALLVVLTCAVLFSLVYFGVYNVAALTGHTKPVYKFLEHARIRAVKVRTDLPAKNLSGINWQNSGMHIYEQHCVFCHGAPGVAPEPFSLGMMPPPSAIVRVARQRSPAELYWVIKNGIKMSGMPAWKYRLTEQELWQLVALIKQLPTLTKSDYAGLAQAQGDGSHASSHEITSVIPPSDQDQQERFSGQIALQQYNCSSCHVIDGIASATYDVGPPLTTMVKRRFIAGILPTTRENLIQWIMHPTTIKPDSMMPYLQVKRQHAEAMVDYLYQIAEH